MQPRELFGVIVRAGGASCFLFGFFDGAYAICKTMGIPTGSPKPLAEDVFGAVIWFLAAMILSLGAEQIVRLMYGRVHPIQ
jgi:hypothetical protein